MQRTAVLRTGALVVFAILAGLTLAKNPFSSPGTPKPALLTSAKAEMNGATVPTPTIARRQGLAYRPRNPQIDTSGFSYMISKLKDWGPGASLEKVDESYRDFQKTAIEPFDRSIENLRKAGDLPNVATMSMGQAMVFNGLGETRRSLETLASARSIAESDDRIAQEILFSIIYLQGIGSMRLGENENCIDCRGESSCILPISAAAVHVKPEGSRAAIAYFHEYLEQFPDDLEIRWLLNLAHMTLGEYPARVDPKYLIPLDRFQKSEFDIGKFRDVGHLVGVNRLNQAGGSIMDDFDNDGLLDIVTTSWDSSMPMAVYRNKGDGTFEERGSSAGVSSQLGGLNCVQADYDNDGNLDIYVPRGAWIRNPIRPSLLRNRGDGTFEDVTERAGLLDPVNSNSATWADYDNDGLLDLFVCCERQQSRLYHQRKDGTFEEVAVKAGLTEPPSSYCKGAAWIDVDNDDYPDLFLSHLRSTGKLFRNRKDGTFEDITSEFGIDKHRIGFSCWAWDYDNDGFLDILATCYQRTVADVVRGLLGQPHARESNRLFHNRGGKAFEDTAKAAGLDMVFETMGSNFGDFDNDGFLDFYLATGEPSLATLIPNRMFRNVDGARFAEITGSSGTGHLQKGHGVACGDWDRDGDIDLFVETGGAVNGDRFHNLLFQNPGLSKNHWLSLKLIGEKSNRSAIGARIKVVTAGAKPQTIHLHVSSGSSFGANPLEQHVGLGKADKVALVEIHWPTSGATQVFRDLDADQALEIRELAATPRKLPRKPLPQPE
ncbi:MAG: hypothetical protein ABS79_04105 [Planctomycetes bacterium SCN 63-9]|nr:MAG: hypothetical protein ABS79_04105 [Planctomycetes bacterium SCN 63-9]